MKKYFLLLTPVPLYICALFFSFGKSFQSHDFAHGFKARYSQEVDGLDPTVLEPIFAQSFHFLGQGKQMTAFESEDGQYVLKLFNPRRPLKQGWYKQWRLWKRYFSLKWIKREWLGKNNRLCKLFLRHKIAFETLKSETGLVYVYLTPSNQMSHSVHLTDSSGKRHPLSLHNVPFVLQEKATLVPAYLQSLSFDERKEAVYRMEQLFLKRIALGITDRIQTMENNYGFVGSKPIQLDVGRIRVDPDLAAHPEEEKERILGSFNRWLSQAGF